MCICLCACGIVIIILTKRATVWLIEKLLILCSGSMFSFCALELDTGRRGNCYLGILSFVRVSIRYKLDYGE